MVEWMIAINMLLNSIANKKIGNFHFKYEIAIDDDCSFTHFYSLLEYRRLQFLQSSYKVIIICSNYLMVSIKVFRKFTNSARP